MCFSPFNQWQMEWEVGRRLRCNWRRTRFPKFHLKAPFSMSVSTENWILSGLEWWHRVGFIPLRRRGNKQGLPSARWAAVRSLSWKASTTKACWGRRWKWFLGTADAGVHLFILPVWCWRRGRNVFEALDQLFVLLTTVTLFCPFPQVFKYLSPPSLLKEMPGVYPPLVLYQASALGTRDDELKKQSSI